MKTCFFLPLLGLSYLFASCVMAQGKANDIPVSALPAEVRQVLESYVNILNESTSLDECAERFTRIAGGSLVNEDAQNIGLRNSVKPYTLKKDFENIRFYTLPVQITRINVSVSNGSGFGLSAIRGKVYKIWIAKKAGSTGLPAPISIMQPEGHPFIKTPKVIGIGSL